MDPAPLGVDMLVYVAVAVTVISGVDYFFGFRRIDESRPAAAQGRGAELADSGCGRFEPLPHRRVVAGVLAGSRARRVISEIRP